ncbi:MAG TPA: SHOCT domain-containing protein [Actinomycetes bacterium]
MDLGDVLWAMLAFFFWFMVIWMFIAIFADVFRRHDLSGWAKAGWILLIVVVPFIGLLIYVIARPRPTEQELRAAGVGYESRTSHSTADELAKLVALRDAGELTPEEFEALKRRATVGA